VSYTYPQFLFPPRPERKIAPHNLAAWEEKGWWCDIKKNGSGSVVLVGPDGAITVKRRDRSEHKAWQPRPQVLQAFRRLPPHSVCAAELLHSKVPGLRDILYIHDLMALEGVHLVGTTFAERRKILHSYFPATTPSIDGHHYVIDQHTWLARTFTQDFAKLFASLKHQDGTPKRGDDEGIVLKNPKTKLELCFKADSNSHWQVKCRLEHKNYQY
jgi:hypothetical protein